MSLGCVPSSLGEVSCVANRWCFAGVGADEAGSSLPPSLFVPSWGIHQRSRVTTPEECRDLMVNLIPPGVREE
ncbi:hypothetical protein Tco_0372421, partial [Tanacetum coccineum]